MNKRTWVAVVHGRYCKTMLVEAESREEAQQKLDDGKGEGISVEYYDTGHARVIREDKPAPDANH